jgi:polyhydroxybutyrate depolymerase
LLWASLGGHEFERRVLHFHGPADEFAPPGGGRGARSISGTHFRSVEHSLRAWIAADGCPDRPALTKLPGKANDGTTVERSVYGPGKEGAEVVLIEIAGGGHTWPGQEARLRLLGKSTQNISANDLMWEFFEKHPLK